MSMRTASRLAVICLALLVLRGTAVRRTNDADEDEAAPQVDAAAAGPGMVEDVPPQEGSASNSGLDDPAEFTREQGRREEPKRREPSARVPKPRPERDYKYEIGVGVIVVLYLINYVIGRRTNQTIANGWGRLILEDTNICSVRPSRDRTS